MSGPRFGPHIRAIRLGYGHSKSLGFYVRVRPEGDRFRIDLCPDDQVVENDKRRGEHYCWWENHESRDLLRLSPAISRRVQIRERQTFVVDDLGEECT